MLSGRSSALDTDYSIKKLTEMWAFLLSGERHAPIFKTTFLHPPVRLRVGYFYPDRMSQVRQSKTIEIPHLGRCC